MRKGKRNEIENKRWDQAGRGRFSSLIGCRLSLAVRSSGCSRLWSSDTSECCRGETESALLHLDDLFLELTWSRWRCESGNTHFCSLSRLHLNNGALSVRSQEELLGLTVCSARMWKEKSEVVFAYFQRRDTKEFVPGLRLVEVSCACLQPHSFLVVECYSADPTCPKCAQVVKERTLFPAKRESEWVDALRLYS